MSLIHKALKKAESHEEQNVVGVKAPEEDFLGEKPGIKSQFTPRTVVLLVLAVMCLVFMIYKKFIYHKSSAPASVPVAAATTPAPALPSAPGTVAPGTTVPVTDASVETLAEEGKKLYSTGKYDDALMKFLEAISKSPQDATILNNMGLTYKKKNDLGQAESYYKRALAIKSDYPECLNNMGVLKASIGDSLEASVYLKKAISVDSTYADAYFNLAVLNDGEGNFREAIANYKLFLQYTDTNDEGLISKIKSRVEQLSE